ncbi:hypothetical protein [Flavobacterium sp.]|uniref:hypothetical protein n=1 Tax=Flavobacterium sp. TaxID=239 RepID=UPI0011F83611|nr:hypothetical protein [Flavobacterium sp.]RZJ71459.1 MAG: hypothetical protein EOO49_10390 [Flavobacterium sp.]
MRISKLIYFVAMLAACIGCSEEESLNSNHRHESKATVKRITIDDVKNQAVVDKLLNPQSRTGKNVVYDSINDFCIDMDYGTFVEKGDYHSYTFKVLRAKPDPNLLENLVISKLAPDVYESLLYQYKLSEEERKLIETNQYVDLSGKVSKIKLENLSFIKDITGKYYFNGNCYEDSWVQVNNTICPEGIHNLSNFNSCWYYSHNEWSPSIYWTVTSSLVPCDTDGGPILTINNPTHNSQGGYGGPGNNNGTITVITQEDAGKKMVRDFLDNLSEEDEECYNGLANKQKQDIRAYIASLAYPEILSEGDTPSCDASLTVAEKQEKAKELFREICDKPNVDFFLSMDSPALIDFSLIDNATPEGQRFRCLYTKLMTSCDFEGLYNNVFGGTRTKANLKFEVVPSFPSPHQNAIAITSTTADANNNISTTIKFQKKFLDGTSALSNIYLVKTIMHEMIHAQLNMLIGETTQNLPILEGLTLEQLTGYLEEPNCTIFTNSGGVLYNQGQHSFMFDNLVPAMQQILNEIYPSLISPSTINQLSSTAINVNGVSLPWSWTKFNKYLAMTGLHNSPAFTDYMNQYPSQSIEYDNYTNYATNITKTCL